MQADGVFELRGPMAPSSLLLTLCAPAAYSAVRATLLLHRRFPITAIVTSVAALPEYPVDVCARSQGSLLVVSNAGRVCVW